MILWTFKDSSWEQVDSSKTFKIQSVFGRTCETEPIASLGMLIGAKNHTITGAPCEQSVFPSDFQYCPYCGSKLLEPHDNAADLWLPPYGTGSGLKLFVIESSSKHEAGERDRKATPFPLPSRDGHFSFASIRMEARQRLLLALQRDNGQLWVFRPGDKKKWEMLNGNAGEDTLPVWSWSLAVDSSEAGLCIPTDKGPAWITIDWATSSIGVDRAEGRSVGGAIRLGKHVLAPVMRGDSFVMVSRKDGESFWSECSSASDPTTALSLLCIRPDQAASMGIPVIDEGKQIAYWPCRGGYIRAFSADSSDGVSWEFRSWEGDAYPAMALIELGPPYRKTGARSGFWQLCEDRDSSVRDGIVNKIIKLDGDEHIDSENVECGQFVTTGRASFSWSDDYWDDIHKRNPRIDEQKELRFPLLQFGEKGLSLVAKAIPWEGRDELGVFTDLFFNRNLKITTFVRLVLEGSSVSERALYAEGVAGAHNWVSGSLFRVELSHLPEISTFVYGKSLFVYFPEKNDCYCWPLESVEG